MAKQCADCRFFEHVIGVSGDCRRAAPQAHVSLTVGREDGAVAIWPLVDSSDWCGEFEEKSN